MTSHKLGRKKGHRERTLRNLATSIFLYESVTTTTAKARAVTPMVERLIARATTGNLTSLRKAKGLLFDMNAVQKLHEDIIPRKGNRTSGFVRLTKLPVRSGDGASMTRIELLLTPIEKLVAETSKTKTTVRKAVTPEGKTI
jgi:large subunit ribosomal protein L17